MFRLLIVLTLFAPPCVFVAVMWTDGPGIDFNWYAVLLISHFGMAFHYVAGPWWCGGYYFRYFFPAALIAAAYHSAQFPGLILSLTLLALLLCAAHFLLARRPHGETIELSFPLPEGRVCVGQGGAYAFLNRHARSLSQRYALDLVQLNNWGSRARGLHPADCNRYFVFGSNVVSPCDGTVTHVADGLPDLTPPRRDAENVAGNHVVIREEKSGAIIGLAHLQCGSVLVKEGEKVRAGQPMGRVGNSGHTTEPHLHIHCKRGGRDDSMLDGEGVPMLFDARFLVRNDIVRSREVRLRTNIESQSQSAS